jgi:hypothetical protein
MLIQPKSLRLTLLSLASTGIVLGLSVLVLRLSPIWLVGTPDGVSAAERLNAVNTVRTTLIQFVGAFGLYGSIVYAARTFALTGRGQSADRYMKAIEQIACDEPRIIIGGIYALEQIAREDKRYASVVIDVLSALVRERASRPVSAVPADVQAALTALTRFKSGTGYLDLRNLHLPGVNLQNAKFQRAKLSGSDLSGAILVDADLAGADLSRSSLANADLSGATLREASLIDTVLVNARRHRVDMAGADLTGAVGL